MPIPGNALKPKVMFWCEMTFYAANQDNNQHDRPQHDVEAMKAGQHEERRAIGT